MEITTILAQLKDKFGDKIDIAKVTEQLKGMDLKNLDMNAIVNKLGINNMVGDLDGDGVKESLIDEIKGKAAEVFHMHL